MLEIRTHSRINASRINASLTHQCLPPSLTHPQKNQPNNNAQGAFAERTATCLQKWGGAALQCRSRGRRPAVGQPDPAAVHYHVCIYCTTSVYLPFSTVLRSLHGIALRSRWGNAGCVQTCADVFQYLLFVVTRLHCTACWVAASLPLINDSLMTHWQVGAKIYSYRLDQRVRTRTALCNIPPAFSYIHETPNACATASIAGQGSAAHHQRRTREVLLR